MPFHIRGIIEGFYGEPWTHANRLSLVDWMAELGFNYLVYSPKDDPYHRVWWERLYPAGKLAELEELATKARERGIRLCYALAPGLSIRYADPQSVERITAKLGQLYEIGIRDFGLFFDDIPTSLDPESERRFGTFAAAQAHVTNEVVALMKERDPELSFTFCPTHYHGDPDHPYLHELGEKLDPAVMVYWTGPRICSETIPKEDAQRFAAVLRRKPLYWDNYPVNDAAMVGELHIRPYRGRDPALEELAEGIVLNPMPLFEASKFALATAARYLDDPMGYDPEEAFEWALGKLGFSEELKTAWRFLADTVWLSPLEGEDRSRFSQTVAEAVALVRDLKPSEAVQRLTALFQSGKEAVARIRLDGEQKALAAEVEPWLAELEAWCDLGLAVVRLMQELFGRAEGEELHMGDASLQALVATIKERLRQSVDFTTHTCGNAVANLARDIVVRLNAQAARGIVPEPADEEGAGA